MGAFGQQALHGVCSEEHRARWVPKNIPALQPGPLFTLGSFFLAFIFFRALCCFRSCKKSRQRREKSIDQTIYFSRRTEKVRDSPSFWDRSGNLRFSRPLSFRSLYGWLFLSACPQPLTKHTGCGLCQASPGRVQEVEIWGSEGSWPLGLRGPRSLLDLTSGGSGYAGSFLPGVEGTANGDRRPCPEDSSL